MNKTNHEEKLFESIFSSVTENMSHICEQNDIDFIIKRLSRNRDFIKSICLLPYWFFSCFENENNIDIQNELFILGKANLQACIAYTLYDYLRDGKIEKQHINISLSIANMFTQKSIKDFYSLVNNDTNKINIINNILNTMDSSYQDDTIISDIHYHFKYMCENVYKKSIGMSIVSIIIVWLLGSDINSNNHIETFEFFKNYLNARQLSDDNDDMCDDMLKNIYTPATFLMKAQYSNDYIRTMIRSRIDVSMRSAYENLKNISFFDYERFIELYVKEC